jgi:hypothetical protein
VSFNWQEWHIPLRNYSTNLYGSANQQNLSAELEMKRKGHMPLFEKQRPIGYSIVGHVFGRCISAWLTSGQFECSIMTWGCIHSKMHAATSPLSRNADNKPKSVASVACSLCYRKKRKCDRKLPSCGRCVQYATAKETLHNNLYR